MAGRRQDRFTSSSLVSRCEVGLCTVTASIDLEKSSATGNSARSRPFGEIRSCKRWHGSRILETGMWESKGRTISRAYRVDDRMNRPSDKLSSCHIVSVRDD